MYWHISPVTQWELQPRRVCKEKHVALVSSLGEAFLSSFSTQLRCTPTQPELHVFAEMWVVNASTKSL